METREIREGMTVRSSDGQKLGKVIRCGADEFIIEKGFFFPKDYVARYDQASVSGDEVMLSLPASSLREAGDRGDLRDREETAGGMGTHLGTYAGGESGVGDEGRIGAGGGGRAVTDGEGERTGRLAQGTSEEVRVPVAEEEVEIRKHPVVKEEVRISKTARQQERRAEGDVRREEVKVDKEGDVEGRGDTGAIGEPEE